MNNSFDSIKALSEYEEKKRETIEKHMSRKVYFTDLSAQIADDAEIGENTVIRSGVVIEPGCRIGKNCVIGPNTVISKSVIGDGVKVNSSQVYDSAIGKNTTVGPFAHIRNNCRIGESCRIGNFVELKNSVVKDKSKISHLSYIGDAELGENVNMGCGTITVNYDGIGKYKTKILDNAFVGCNSNLIAPVTIGKGALIAAGTTVHEDVPDGALAISRPRQTVKPGGASKIFGLKREKKEKSGE
ncbi:MAG: hypothetical protein GX541_01510 [Clostridiales bacterium]|jgi:bifunctional UDP-N-acetylglucosamine pyrophosphorylase/glucosamine-1-phosphate N-acetyltransferase|nr:hypothetical protein [Clostridiales bacterium]